MKYTKEMKQFIIDNNYMKPAKELAAMFNERFGTDITWKQIRQFRNNNRLNSGLTGRFEKGHVPINKGTKGMFNVGGNSGSFKKGNRPTQYLPIGTERNLSGYIYVKVDDKPNARKWDNWKPKHYLVWEEHNGPVPNGYVVTFLDNDRTNCTIENLALITKAENIIMNRQGMYYNDPELTKTSIAIAKVISKVNKRGNK